MPFRFGFGRQSRSRSFDFIQSILLMGLISPLHLLAGEFSSKGGIVSTGSDGWRWSIRQGAAHRSLGDISFNSGSFSNVSVLPPAMLGPSAGMVTRIEDLGIGPTNAFADRTYLDGFVFIDSQTANPASFLPGTTAFWGYDSNSQIVGDNLFFSGGSYTTFSATALRTVSDSDWNDEIDGAAPVIELEVLKPLNGRFSIGAMAGFLFLSQDSVNSATNFRAIQNQTGSTFAVSDRYALQGVIPPLAPYAGTFTSPGTAPLIDNIPTERIITDAGTTVGSTDFFNQVSESLNLDFYTLSLGPVIRYDTGGLFFTSSLGFALNIADWDAGFSERLNQSSAGATTVVNSWQASSGGTKLLPGLYLQGSAGYQFSEHWAASVTGRYDWCESLRASVGASDFQVDLSGYTLEVGVTYTF